MHMHHDHHANRDPQVPEEPLDAANQSLADALRSSFGILRLIMLVLLVLYLFSNVRRVQPHEEALHLRLGVLLPEVHSAGLVWGFPFPIDEIVPLPTKKSNELLIDSHTFYRSAKEVAKPLAFISRSPTTGLDPEVDGALLTADAGLVHTRWKTTYRINDVGSFVSGFIGDEIETAADLIRELVETVGIQVASEMTAEEMIRTRVDVVQGEMRQRVNERLAALNSGIRIAQVEMYEPTPPLQIREAFDSTQRAENYKKRTIDKARQEETRILNRAAGAAHRELVALLETIEATAPGDPAIAGLRAEVDRLLLEDAEGEAGRLIKEAAAYHAKVVGQMDSDLNLYETLLPEYERDPDLLIGRLWEDARQVIFNHHGVIKVYRPPGSEIRIRVDRDPEQTRLEEAQRLQEQTFDVDKLRPRKKPVALGPEAG